MMIEFPVDRDYVAMVDAVLTRWSTEVVPGSAAAFDPKAWLHLEELGLTRLTGAEDRGGSGAGWLEAAVLQRLAGYHCAALPLAEHDLLGGWLAERFDLPADDRLTSVGLRRATDADIVVPYGRNADRLLLLIESDQWSLLDVPAADVEWRRDQNLAGEPRDRLIDLPDAGRPVDAGVAEEVMASLQLRGALARSAQLCGALDRCIELAVEHAAVREQFGRPLVTFQAVQALLADAAAETALAQAATLGAVEAMAASEQAREAQRAVAVAKSCASHAAGVVCRNTHQVLGAIGFTTEHALHRSTGRLLAWRDEFGTRDTWDRALLDDVMRPDGDAWLSVVGH
ncbi:acyl-CoA dehydrogenase family protein [Nocardioides sp. AN3]